ncbi:hypothetical protein [Thauera humireducens]|uniref:hypothetical protein n=1 Tax=Thauera humireducens TaxID=1134435 RepID=UPI00311EE425
MRPHRAAAGGQAHPAADEQRDHHLVKDTSLIYVLALNDLLRAARGIVQRDFTITPFVVAAGFYLLMTLVLTWPVPAPGETPCRL